MLDGQLSGFYFRYVEQVVDDLQEIHAVAFDDIERFVGVYRRLLIEQEIGEAENGRDALQKIGKFKPDLVFLDLQMPVLSGFEVVRGLTELPLPIIVIVPAFDQHAIQAFEAGAIDYLLKPVSEARLQKSVERAKAMLNRPMEIANQVAQIASLSTPSNPAKSRRIVGRNGSDYILLDADEVLAFQAEREVVILFHQAVEQRFVIRASHLFNLHR